MATFFASKNVNIFPCARRGTYREEGSDKDNIYNPESRFVSEANLTKLSGLAFGRDSYIISRPESVSEAGIWKLVIKGYYFELIVEKNELTVEENNLTEETREGYFIIGLEDTEDISHIRLAALKESSGSLISINKGATSLDADGSCRAICFISSIEEPSGKDLYCVHSEATLENLDKSYANLSMSETLSGIGARLDVIEGEGEGSVKKALIDAETYADGLASNYDAAGAAADVRTYVDGTFKATIEDQVNTNKEAIEALKTAISGSGTLEGSVDMSITSRVTRAEGEITSLEETIGTLPTGEDAYTTLVGGITVAKQAGLDAAQNLTEEVSTRTKITDDHEGRISAMEAFFEGAAADEGEGENLKNALDTLKEIQEFATSEGTAAGSMLASIDANTQAITALQDIVKDGGTLEIRVDDTQTRVGAVETRAKTLENILDGYADTNDDPYKTVKAHVEAVSVRADTAQADINTLGVVVNGKAESTEGAGDSVVGLVDKVEVLEATIGNTGSGLVKDVAANAEAIATLVGSEEGDDTKSVRTIVAEETGEIREAITNLQNTCLSNTDVEGNKLGIYAVAFDLSKGPEDLSPEFEEATSRPIVFISRCSMLPSPPEGYAWFNSPNDDAIKVETIGTNIILYLKEISSPEEDPESPSTT